MKKSIIKLLTTFLLLVLYGLMPSFAQNNGYSTIYIDCQSGGPIYSSIVEINEKHLTTMPHRSYIVIKTNYDKLLLRQWLVEKGTSYETIIEKENKRKRKTPVYEILLAPNSEHYVRLVGGLINEITKSTFEKKKEKFTFHGEYVLDDNDNNSNIIKQNDIPQQAQSTQQQVVTQPVTATVTEAFVSDVDVNIPTTGKKASETFVLIIANEDYQYIDKVKYAARDGEIFKEYCINTLGVPEKQVRYCPNASFGVINGGVDWLRYALENFEGSRGIVYYCGHGIPDEHSGDAYIIPVDGKGTNMMTCYSLNALYTTLAATNADNITYFMDACFTGANKEGSMLVAARGVAREPKKETLEGKSVVFSASSGDETAMTNEEQHHGLFTYYLLKKIQDTKGDVSYEELAAYISKNVKKDAFLLNEKPQNPVVATSPDAQDSWKTMNLK